MVYPMSAADLICIQLHDSGFLHAKSLARVNTSCRQEECGIDTPRASVRERRTVLSGDPRQMGPIVKTKLAQALSHGVSMLERLMANPLYTRERGIKPKAEMREGNNPSWFNPGEVVQMMLYCCQLAKKLYNPVAATDIGIIAPYRKQVRANESVQGNDLQSIL
ncbi:RNA helicase Mov10l1 isoform X3 [Salmo salar]|uniref:RNA helicase Mov10l1 isoform X3 n=1 Tax=Salmo salar TaxID=8030 RepID=A0ABM3DU99_SALSA|nr:RNA helicase Mov10l1 isoform X3 [Salmo salar]